MNVLAAITHVKYLLLEASAFTFFADEFDVGEKLHLDRHRAVALTDFTTTAGHVERKMRGIEAMRLGFARGRERFANRVVDFYVGHGIRTRSAADRRLIYENYFIDMLRAFKLLISTDVPLPFAALLLQTGIDAIVNQSGFTRAADSGHTNQHIERDIDVDSFQIMLAGATNLQTFKR